jgi:hypothetical protein
MNATKRLYADFNERDGSGRCVVLRHNDVDINVSQNRAGLKGGDRVELFQDEEDFTVQAVLEEEFDQSGNSFLVARPLWETIVRH